MDTPRPQLLYFQFHQNNDSFTLHFQQRLILTHCKDNPFLWIGSGLAAIDMFRVNVSIKDKHQDKIALTAAIISRSPDVRLLHFTGGSNIGSSINNSADDPACVCWGIQTENTYQ
ncbi:alpha-glucosidase, partial [Escherichia coli]